MTASRQPSPSSDQLRAGAVSIVQALQEAGHISYLAGGCVRDGLLGIEPKDYDVATSATPDQIRLVFPKAKGVGAHFGVLLVRVKGTVYEVATFREDGEYSDGRRPDSVSFSSPERDAQRRDFTINGLFEDPITGEVIDFVGGQEDLQAGILRCIGNPRERFGEDHLRLLRAVRFAARLGYEIEPETLAALEELAPQLATVSPERIQMELSRILTHPNRVRGFDLLVETRLMEQIMPEIYDLQGCEQPPQFHPEGDVFTHVRLMLEKLEPGADLAVVLSVLLHDIGKPATQEWDEAAGRFRFNGHAQLGGQMAGEILRRLRYPNEVIDRVAHSVSRHMDFMNVQKMRRAKLRRFIGAEHFEDELALHRVDCLGSNGNLENYDFVRSEIEALANEPAVPPRLLTGSHLIARGIKPGKEMGRILREAQDLQLEGMLATQEEAFAWLEKRVGEE